jgi:putative ABC transport system permease protein
MRAALVIQAALRESRGARGRLVFFTACLAIGVAAIVGVAGLIAAIEHGIDAKSRELLSADMSIDARRELPKELDAELAKSPIAAGFDRTDVRELATLTSNPRTKKSRLVEVKAVGSRFPYYGEVKLDPPGDFGAALSDETAIVAPDLVDALGIRVGDSISIGKAQFRVAAVVTEEPGRLDFALTIGPRVFLTLGGLERADIGSFGSRIRYKALFKFRGDPAPRELAALKTSLEKALPDAAYLNIDTHGDAQPTIRRAIQRVESYLGLGALLSLVLGGTGVAMIVRAWLSSRTNSIAVMRCLGFRPREILILYAGNIGLFALVGSLIGSLAGSLVPLVMPTLMPGFLPSGVVLHWEPASIVRGLVLGVVIAIVFSMPALTAIWRVPPTRVLRVEAEPLPPNRFVQAATFALLVLGLFGAAWLQSRSAAFASLFTGGVALLAAALTLGAWTLRRLAARLPRERLDPYLRHGIAALTRPGAGITGAVVALGLGVLVVTAMGLVQTRLAERLRSALPPEAPTVFLLDVQADQLEDVRTALAEHGATAINSVPVVTARLSSVDGVDVKTLADRRKDDDDPERRTWMLTREQRLTWMTDLPKDNTIVDGALWKDPSPHEVSVEEEYARDLGAKVGSKLVFDIQGVPLELVVTSLRRVDWESFGINFFLVAEPGALDDAPHFELAAARLERDVELATQDDIANEFPNVVFLRVRTILEKLLSILLRLDVGVRILGSFTILTGIVILSGVISASALHRAREVALLKTLGVTRAGVTALFATEFALVGLVAGCIGALFAFVMAWEFLEHAVDVPPELPWWPIPAAGVATAALAAVFGLLACGRALRARPIESLRG